MVLAVGVVGALAVPTRLPRRAVGGDSAKTHFPPIAVTRLGLVADSVRDFLGSQWDSAYADPKTSLEMGMCLSVYIDPVNPSLWFVMNARRGRTLAATHRSVQWVCGPGEVLLHTHPPVTCNALNGKTIPCQASGWWAHQCAPSDRDLDYRPRDAEDFKALQCDRNAVVFYRPLQFYDTSSIALP